MSETEIAILPGQPASTLQLQSFGVHLDLFCQDVLPMQPDRYQYHPFQVQPRFLRSWYIFQPPARVRYITPIASQRLYIQTEGAPTSHETPQLRGCDLPCMWMCDDGQLVVSWLQSDASSVNLHLKYASGADLRSMDAHGLQRIIYQLGIAISLNLADTDEASNLQQQLQHLDDQSYQAALAQC